MKKILQIGLLLAVSITQAQNAAMLKAEIERLKKDTCLSHASWSIFVSDTKTDSIITDYNSNISLIPASIQKTITTYSALTLLGWDYKYKTILEYDGEIDTVSKTLYGNLYIKGSGDPTLGSETFKKQSDTIELTDQWARLLAYRIKSIEGAIIGDASAFEDEVIPSTWVWGDIGNYYGAGPCGLNFKDNKFALHYKSGHKKGDTTIITKITPAIPDLKIENYVRTGLYSNDVYIFGSPYDNLRYARGVVGMRKTDYKVEGSIPDPALFCAQSLESSLKKLNITISQPATSTRLLKSISTNRKEIYTHQSHSIDKIVYETNIQSNNLFAESLLKTIAYETKKIGNEQSGIDTVLGFWQSKHIDLKGMFMVDGSGLSRYNAISTRHMGKILNSIANGDSTLFNKFYESLPIAGKSGSLGKLCKGTRAENNVHAKSGSMTRVRSYAGYVTSKKKHLLSFAVIVNNYDCQPQLIREKLEKLMIAMAEIV